MKSCAGKYIIHDLHNVCYTISLKGGRRIEHIIFRDNARLDHILFDGEKNEKAQWSVGLVCEANLNGLFSTNNNACCSFWIMLDLA